MGPIQLVYTKSQRVHESVSTELQIFPGAKSAPSEVYSEKISHQILRPSEVNAEENTEGTQRKIQSILTVGYEVHPQGVPKTLSNTSVCLCKGMRNARRLRDKQSRLRGATEAQARSAHENIDKLFTFLHLTR